ncbi:MAG TPA: FUSC family protein [Solirubrobacteraceae bacterium]|nr:FUSC family protein [Solirubrobacteraceae bacterium]
MQHPLQWLAQRDRDLAALRRAGRSAIVMPAMFALGDKVIQNAALATFAAFGSFAMLLLVDFGGPMRARLEAQLALSVTGCTFVCLGTLASRTVWISAVAMAVIGLVVIFAGVVSSVLAGASTSLLLAFILPVTNPAPISAVPDRLAGWGMASGAALLAVALLWPTPARGPLRDAAASACRALAARMRAEVAFRISGDDPALAGDHERADAIAEQAVAAMRRVFLATPFRPTGLNTAARTVVRLVDEINWLDAILDHSVAPRAGTPVNRPACALKLAAATVLERGAELLGATGGDARPLREALDELQTAMRTIEANAPAELQLKGSPATASASSFASASISAGGNDRSSSGPAAGSDDNLPAARELISALDPSFRAQELGYAVSVIAENIDLTAAAERRSWIDRVLGRQPKGLIGTVAAAQQRAAAHIDLSSVWLHNSVRGAVGLGLAVLVANETGVQHSFWVVLGTLSVLRSNALSTGQNIVRGLLGTVAGFVVGGLLLTLIGADTTLLWFLLPIAILFAGVAPAAISFAAGQAALTLVLVFLFNIIQPAGWDVGLVRVQDIAIGCGVSLLVGLLFWPRGAGAELRRALGAAYVDSARYLSGAVDFGMRRCEVTAAAAAAVEPTEDAARAAASARRLDDTFRSYLAERGSKPVPLAEISGLVTAVGGLRIAADAVLDLWQREDGTVPGDRAAAREQLLRSSEQIEGWYDNLAARLADGRPPNAPLGHDELADGRLIDAVRNDLRAADGRATATAVRVIWTGDHLDAVRRLQQLIVEPARVAVGQ